MRFTSRNSRITMKVLFISAAILALSASVIKSEDDGNNKINTFKTSLELIEKINNDPESTWKAGQNFDANLPVRYFNRLTGLKRKKVRPLQRLEPLHDDTTENLKIPKSFDSRKKWKFCKSLQQIRDQGDCGSCWAVAAASAFTDRLCIATKGKFNGHLSAEELLSCCHKCGDGCDGGDDGPAWDYFRDHGIVSGGDYNSSEGCIPYSLQACEHHVIGPRPPCPSLDPVYTPQCSKKCTNKLYKHSFKRDHHKVVRAYSVARNVQAIQREILKHGPVEAGFRVYDDFLVYKSGVYYPTKYSNATGGGHAVKLIGWGESKGTPYWLVQNSWNTDWGEKGLFRILRGKNTCGFEEEINAGIPSTKRFA